MSNISICCDFDGTICVPDACDFLLQRFATDEWKQLDEAVWRGEITEREAFPRQMALIHATWEEALAALGEGVRIRDGFAEFVSFCRKEKLPLAILSSGLEDLIRALLQRAGVNDVPVLAHGSVVNGSNWQVIPRVGERLAEHCSHCKCVYVLAEKSAGKRIVYIGDGYTDLCPVQHADVVFATRALAKSCDETGRPYYGFKTFYDIERKLGELLQLEQDLRR